ncbi:unnamed protein product [Heligmosomoides polygyrus]|uniref:SCP domain-containing protein n=1 Tax=Heligmosomoides polygyrus TaxID=6339 RepID=A0A183FM93_HELPZ|nr:unnamed protein product [Heligmosomoides polygyrus]
MTSVFLALECYNNGLSDFQRRLFLNFHNGLRRKVAKGERTLGSGEPLATASNMYKLKWSCILENEISDRLKRCQEDQPPLEGFAVNIKAIPNYQFEGSIDSEEIVEVVESWWSAMRDYEDEYENYDYGSDGNIKYNFNSGLSEDDVDDGEDEVDDNDGGSR